MAALHGGPGLNRRLLGYFTALFLPSAALLIAAAALAYTIQARHQVDALEVRERLDAQRGAQTLSAYVEDFTRDVLFIRSLPMMEQAAQATAVCRSRRFRSSGSSSNTREVLTRAVSPAKRGALNAAKQ